MTVVVADLVAEARTDLLDDSVTPYLWSDVQLTRYANEGIKEACQRAPLLVKSKNITVVATTAEYALDSYLKQISYAKLNLATKPLKQTTETELDMTRGYGWRTRTGTPTHYIRRGHRITLFPIPIVNDTLVTTGTFIPDSTFVLDTDFDPAYLKDLLFWIAYKAFLFPDADTYNPVKAADFLRMFEAKFGIAHSAKYNAVVQNNPMYGTVISGRMC